MDWVSISKIESHFIIIYSVLAFSAGRTSFSSHEDDKGLEFKSEIRKAMSGSLSAVLLMVIPIGLVLVLPDKIGEFVIFTIFFCVLAHMLMLYVYKVEKQSLMPLSIEISEGIIFFDKAVIEFKAVLTIFLLVIIANYLYFKS